MPIIEREKDDYGDDALYIEYDDEGRYARIVFNHTGEWYALVGYPEADLSGPIEKTALRALRAAWKEWDEGEAYFNELNAAFDQGRVVIKDGTWTVKPLN